MKKVTLLLSIITMLVLTGCETETTVQITCGPGTTLINYVCVADEPTVIDVGEEFDTVFEVLDLLETYHYKQPDRDLLIEGMIDGMIDILDDPHTQYFDSEEKLIFDNSMGEDYVGVGIQIRYQDETIVIEGVFDNSPADIGGIRENDVITHVDGTYVVGMEYYDIIAMLVGDEGTNVVIGVYRQGVDETLYFEMTRSVIENPSVTSTTYTVNNETIGYIKVNTFGSETFVKFYNAVTDLETAGIDGLIVDLRGNGGGSLGTVVDMLQEFLNKDGNEMFSTEHYLSGVLEIDEYHGYKYTNKPYDIVTLINGSSASASEVFASSMQEHGGYTVVGTLSYGKGTMQIDADLDTTETLIHEYENGENVSYNIYDYLHISIGKWITADGNWVHFDGGTDGVTPDIIIEPSPAELVYKVFLLGGDPLVEDTVDSRTANIQIFLNAIGYSVREDGYFDTATKTAIEDLQTQHIIPVTGQIDDATLEVLNTLIHEYQNNPDNDSQLQGAIDHLTND